MDVLDRLLQGAVDSHLHAGPGCVPRSLDAAEAAREAIEAGLRAIVLKDHHSPTASLARLVESRFARPGFRVLGSVVLNHAVGGLNPKAVEAALLAGARVVWMPTVSALNDVRQHASGAWPFPNVPRVDRMEADPLTVLDPQGRLREEAQKVLEALASRPEAVLATGHLSAEEVDVLLPAALALGIRKIVVTHAVYLVGATLEQMKRWSQQGAYIELCACVCSPSSRYFCVPVDRTLAVIREVGPQRVILSSDLGQVGNLRPVEGLKRWIGELQELGVPPQDLRTMLVDNPSRLLLEE